MKFLPLYPEWSAAGLSVGRCWSTFSACEQKTAGAQLWSSRGLSCGEPMPTRRWRTQPQKVPALGFVHFHLSTLSQSSDFPRGYSSRGTAEKHGPSPASRLQPRGATSGKATPSVTTTQSKGEVLRSASHSEHAVSSFHTRSCTEYPSSKWDFCSFTSMGTGFGPQFNIQQVPNDHQTKTPKALKQTYRSKWETRNSQAMEAKKRCTLKMFPTTYKNKCRMWCFLSFINLFLQESATWSMHFLEVPCMHSLWMLLYNFIS